MIEKDIYVSKKCMNSEFSEKGLPSHEKTSDKHGSLLCCRMSMASLLQYTHISLPLQPAGENNFNSQMNQGCNSFLSALISSIFFNPKIREEKYNQKWILKPRFSSDPYYKDTVLTTKNFNQKKVSNGKLQLCNLQIQIILKG